MRAIAYVVATFVLLTAASAIAHGPQIQITNDGGKIVTRQLIADGPYSNSLTPAKSVYVMPLLEFNGAWYSRPNSAIDPILDVPAFPSGPGFAYGYDLADGGAQLFETGSILSLAFTDGLKQWNGASYVDAGAIQLKAFRGSNASISSPPENFATTSDAGPFDSLDLPAVAANYGTELAEVHTSLRFALLGDGANPLSASPDGVYLLNMQLKSTQNGLAASDPYFFVLYKNPAPGLVLNAVNALGFSASAVQFADVPEPAALSLAIVGLVGLSSARLRRVGEVLTT
jgi:hypothetical protein